MHERKPHSRTYAHERRKLKPKKGEMEVKFAELIANEQKTIVLAQYIRATGRFAEERQERASKEVDKRAPTGRE